MHWRSVERLVVRIALFDDVGLQSGRRWGGRSGRQQTLGLRQLRPQSLKHHRWVGAAAMREGGPVPSPRAI